MARLKPLDQQTIVITGPSSALGLATAKMAAKRGASVVLAARDGDALARIVADIEAAGARPYTWSPMSPKKTKFSTSLTSLASCSAASTLGSIMPASASSAIRMAKTDDERS